MTHTDRQMFADMRAAIEEGRDEDAGSLAAALTPNDPDLAAIWERACSEEDDTLAVAILDEARF